MAPESHQMNGTQLNITDYGTVIHQIMANMDDMFLALMGSLIVLMQAGFAFLEAGSVRAKNTINILIKNFADLCFGALAFWLVGFALAFGEGNPIFGLTGFAAIGLPASQYTFLFFQVSTAFVLHNPYPKIHLLDRSFHVSNTDFPYTLLASRPSPSNLMRLLFQCTFAATCATIVSGAIAERCHFNGYIIFSCIITGVLYPIATHWCWSQEGWLAQMGFQDFAGSGVVHMSGGASALVGAYILGPRIDRFTNKNSIYISGHSIPLITLGGFILVMGFMAFNAGSQGSISQKGDGEAVGHAVMSTLVSCGTGGAMVLLLYKFFGGGTWSLAKIINGCLSGMVSVAGGCDSYYPWSACLIAALSAPIHLGVSNLLVKLRIDDPVDAVAVHFGSGLLGLLVSPLFRKDGVLATGSSASLNMLMWNALGALVLIAFYLVTSALLFLALDKMGIFRVDPKDEITGLDLIKHSERAYDYDTGSSHGIAILSTRKHPISPLEERQMTDLPTDLGNP
eukprot:maker-scaffold2514_size14919-snap-gene-0.4 protein:Tk12176 transcript:maker-scaffold2514_size14919-snap-gene-0.4-mRNA-1 annotation:"predicted protein"